MALVFRWSVSLVALAIVGILFGQVDARSVYAGHHSQDLTDVIGRTGNGTLPASLCSDAGYAVIVETLVGI